MSKAPSKVDQIRALREARFERKKGRPPKGETRDKPWKALGMSKATYYRKFKVAKG